MSSRKSEVAFSGAKRSSNSLYFCVKLESYILRMFIILLMIVYMVILVQADKRHRVEKASNSKTTIICDNCTNSVQTSTLPTITTTTSIYQASNLSSQPQPFNPTSHPLSLITKTTDAIYRALSSVFSYDEHEPNASTTITPEKHSSLIRDGPMNTGKPSEVGSSTRKPSSKKSSTTNRLVDTPATVVTKPPATTTTSSKFAHPSSASVVSATTLRPRVSTTTATAKPTSSAFVTSNMTTDKNAQLLDLISNLIKSLDSLREAQSNRTIRVAPDVDFSDFGVESGKLVVGPDNQAATSEDVHLLCKLLQRHLTQSSSNVSTLAPSILRPSNDPFRAALSTSRPPKTIGPNTTMGISGTSQTSTPTSNIKTINSNQPILTTITPNLLTTPIGNIEEDFQYVSSVEDLGEKHERHLLESILNFDRGRINETKAERLLSDMFNDGARIGRNRKLAIDGASDYELENPITEKGLTSPPSSLLIYVSPKYTKSPRSSHLHLVYWLLARPSNTTGDTRLKLMDAREAGAILDELEHSQLKRQLSAASISVPGVLVSAFNTSRDTKGNELSHKDEQEPPKTIDDSLSSSSSEDTKKPVSSLQLLLNKLTSSSFTEYLYLYFILFAFLLLLIVLCFALPMINWKMSSGDRRRPDSTTRRTDRRLKVPESPAISIINDPSSHVNYGMSDEQQKGVSTDSIWRKLSSSTSTLVQDESRELRSDGTMAVPVVPEKRQEEQMGGKRAQFEWYSFEDRLEQLTRTIDRDSQTYTLHEDKISKSLRKHDNSLHPPQSTLCCNEEQILEFKDRTENRSSNTLTKSELVMLKEKLVPIASSSRRQVGSQTSFEQEAASLPSSKGMTNRRNEQHQTGSSSGAEESRNYIHDSLASHFIDSIEASCSIGADDLRQPKMRHVELPARTSSKVDAIKAELSRVEKRDMAASAALLSSSRMPSTSSVKSESATYKRYEI